MSALGASLSARVVGRPSLPPHRPPPDRDVAVLAAAACARAAAVGCSSNAAAALLDTRVVLVEAFGPVGYVGYFWW